MKASNFDYVKAASVGQVFDLLSEHGDDARILAGGQSLLPTLNMRLSEPRLLIDITGLDELRGMALDGEVLRLGALVRHAEIERSELVARRAPLLALAAPFIAHRAIRNRGTLGGSVANGDPAAEWPACLAALDAKLVLRSARGERRVAATEFFLDVYTTDLGPDELLVACEIPVSAAAGRFAFDEIVRRRGDYATAGLAAGIWTKDGRIEQARLAFLAVGSVPFRARAAESALAGQALDDAAIEAAQAALAEELDPAADLTHSSQTKAHLARVLLGRVLRRIGG